MTETNKTEAAPTAQQMIEDLKKAAIFAETLSEVHIENLRTYPFIAFNEAKNVEMTWDLRVNTPNDGCTIRYNMVTDPEGEESTRNDPLLKERLSFVQKCVQTLLWADTVVEFTINGKTF